MKRGWKYWAFIRIPFWFLISSIFLVTLLRWVPVRYTPLMLKRAFQFRSDDSYHREQKWVPLEDISPELIKAVLACEDQKFYDHCGFDWEEMKAMWQKHRTEGTPLRGCSTISQQTAKNVFTLATHTWARKAMEAYWTLLIELIWGKRRILEVYLNVAETGKGLYGIEAAAQYYFDQISSSLDIRNSISICLCLTTPLTIHPDYIPAPLRQHFSDIACTIESNECQHTMLYCIQ